MKNNKIAILVIFIVLIIFTTRLPPKQTDTECTVLEVSLADVFPNILNDYCPETELIRTYNIDAFPYPVDIITGSDVIGLDYLTINGQIISPIQEMDACQDYTGEYAISFVNSGSAMSSTCAQPLVMPISRDLPRTGNVWTNGADSPLGTMSITLAPNWPPETGWSLILREQMELSGCFIEYTTTSPSAEGSYADSSCIGCASGPVMGISAMYTNIVVTRTNELSELRKVSSGAIPADTNLMTIPEGTPIVIELVTTLSPQSSANGILLFVNESCGQCVPDIVCGNYSVCVNGSQSRVCDDGCGNITTEVQACEMPCEPLVVCGNYSDCIDSIQSRICDDGCGNITNETIDCTLPCIPDLQCSNYTSCINGTKSRVCDDGCNPSYIETINCSLPPRKCDVWWQCFPWWIILIILAIYYWSKRR